MYMSLFGCRCKQPLIKPDQAQMKQRWSKPKTTAHQQKIEDDKWGQHVEQGVGQPPPKGRSADPPLVGCHLAHTPTDLSTF